MSISSSVCHSHYIHRSTRFERINYIIIFRKCYIQHSNKGSYSQSNISMKGPAVIVILFMIFYVIILHAIFLYHSQTPKQKKIEFYFSICQTKREINIVIWITELNKNRLIYQNLFGGPAEIYRLPAKTFSIFLFCLHDHVSSSSVSVLFNFCIVLYFIYMNYEWFDSRLTIHLHTSCSQPKWK